MVGMFARRRRWWPILVVSSLLAGSGALIGAASNSTSAAEEVSAAQGMPAGAVNAATQVGYIGAGKRVVLQSSERPFTLTKDQLAARQRVMAEKAKHRAPSLGRHTTSANVAISGGPQTATFPLAAPTDFVVFKRSLVNSTCIGCGQSSINEATSANSGRVVVETSNWNIAYTLHANQAPVPWLNLNPYAFSSGFCCDQQVIYDPGRDVFLLLQLDYAGEGNASNGLALSVASGLNPTSWCTYKFAGAIGGGATDTPDFAKIAVSNNNVFLTWNDYPPNAGFARSGLARMPLDSIANCAGFGYGFLTRTTEFTFALAQSPSTANQFYWVSNWFLDGTTSGANLRIFWWPDNSGSYFWVTRAINAYTFGNVSCGTTNWCSRLDPRFESVVITPAEFRAQANTAFAGDQILEVATSAGPSGFSSGKNYVVYNYFKLNSLSYIGNDQTYSTTTNFAYPGCGVNEYGYVGCAMAQGTTVPGGLILLQDDVNPVQPWGYSFQIAGVNGASAWGDYIETSAWNPTRGPFQTILWRMNASNAIQPFYIVWGRERDRKGYLRWSGR